MLCSALDGPYTLRCVSWCVMFLSMSLPGAGKAGKGGKAKAKKKITVDSDEDSPSDDNLDDDDDFAFVKPKKAPAPRPPAAKKPPSGMRSITEATPMTDSIMEMPRVLWG